VELALTEPKNGSSLEIGSVASPHWWRGLRLQPVSAVFWVGQTGAWGYADSNNSIHPRCLSSHWLWAGEIPSIESLVMSRNTPQAAQLRSPLPHNGMEALHMGGGLVACCILGWNSPCRTHSILYENKKINEHFRATLDKGPRSRIQWNGAILLADLSINWTHGL
jgi:hypothetical protein